MSFSTPLALLLLPIIFGGAVWFWLTGRKAHVTARQFASLLMRLLIFALVILAAAGTTVDRPQSSQAVSFVADLSISTQSGQSSIVSYINDALRARGANDLAALVAMGQSASVERPPAKLTSISRFESVIDPDFTNLESGIALGGALLPSGYRRRVVLLSDGRQNIGDAIGEAQILRQQGIRVDVVPVPIKPGTEVRVESLDVPQNLTKGERFTVLASVASSTVTTTSFDLLEDNRIVQRGSATVPIGQSTISVQVDSATPGLHTFRIVLQPRSDTLTQNNEASAFTDVAGPPRVLIVEGTPGNGVNVAASVRGGGVLTDTIEADGLTPDLSVLQRYAVIVLVDVSADVLGQGTMQSLKSFVSDLGHGLVVLGGLNSYGLGNYGSTPLEDVLPVSMDLPKRKALPRAAVVLIIEDLESQASVDISKRAGEGVVGLLNPEDLVAVSDAGPNLVWPLRHVTDKGAIVRAMDAMQPMDPASYAPFLAQAYDLLRTAKVQTKQIILLGDGDAADDTAALLKKITAAGIQVSTIETNASDASDFQNMRGIAAHGGGKYYPADDVANIPQVFLKVARTVAHNGIIEGTFIPRLDARSPILNSIAKITPLSGYVITTPKELATVVLASDKTDPVLAQWQYGLGRSVAWMSDAQGRWTSKWLAAVQTRNIWSAMVHWVLPPPRSTDLTLSSSVANGQVIIGVDSPGGAAYDTMTARIVGPDSTASVALEPDAQNHFQGTLAVGNAGAYLVTVQGRISGRTGTTSVTKTVTGGVVVPYATDYRDSGLDMATLSAVAAAGGGMVLAHAGESFADNLPSSSAPTPLQTPLLLLALVLFPVDVGIRRLVLDRADVRAILHALRFRRRDQKRSEPVLAPLARVRERRVGQTHPIRSPEAGSSSRVPAKNGDERAAMTGSISPSSRTAPAPVQSVPATTSVVEGEKEIQNPTDPPSNSDSMSARLLEAKRRRSRP